MEKTKFRTAYSGQIRSFTEPGGRMQDVFEYKIDKFGRKKLEKTGETDLYAKIQESLEETKIENILKRAAIGDTSVFRPDGIYADLTQMPSNLIEARQAMQNLENMWKDLDRDIKAKYHFDVEEFIGASGSDSWLRDMGLLQEKPDAAAAAAAETKVEEGAKDE